MEREMPALPHFSLAPFKELCLQSCSFLTAACSTTRYKTFRAHHFWNSPACEELPWNVSTVNCLSTGKQLNPPHTVLLFELTRLQNRQPQNSVLWHQKPGEMIWISHWFVSFTAPCTFHSCRADHPCILHPSLQGSWSSLGYFILFLSKGVMSSFSWIIKNYSKSVTYTFHVRDRNISCCFLISKHHTASFCSFFGPSHLDFRMRIILRSSLLWFCFSLLW